MRYEKTVREARYIENKIAQENCKDYPSNIKIEKYERKLSALRW
jgi:hypothetical protein